MWEEGFFRLKKRMLLYSLFPLFDIISTSYFCKSPADEGTYELGKIMLHYGSVQLGALIGIAWGSILPTIGFAFAWFMIFSWLLRKSEPSRKFILIDFVLMLFCMSNAILSYTGGLSWIFKSLAYTGDIVSVNIGSVLYLVGEIFYVRPFGALISMVKEVFPLNQKNK